MLLHCQESERYTPPASRHDTLMALRHQFAPARQQCGSSLALPIGLDGASFPHHILCRNAVHEFLSESTPAHTLLTQLAHAIVMDDDQSRPLLWIGQCTWPYLLGLTRPLLSRSIFLRPSSAAERLWAIDLAIRSQCVCGIVADGSCFDLASTRRIFLSAQSASMTCLLARPAHESRMPTAASTRWHIAPHPSPEHTKRWKLQLLRCKSNLAAFSTPHHTWIIEYAPALITPDAASTHHTQTGSFRVVANLRDRSDVASPAPRQIARVQ